MAQYLTHAARQYASVRRQLVMIERMGAEVFGSVAVIDPRQGS
jgi:hypothetical protein